MNFGYRFLQFMSGRYGRDKLNDVIWIVALLLSVANLFLRSLVLQFFIYVIVVYAIFRAFSRNTQKRRRENDFFLNKAAFIKRNIDINKQRKADKCHVYKKCPNCKAVLRLPYRAGKHTTVCPRCQKEFTVKVSKRKNI